MRHTSLLALLLATAPLGAQSRPGLTGTVNPRAIGPALEQPPPIGGLRGRPLTPAGARELPASRTRRGRYPYSIADAPLLRGGAVVPSTVVRTGTASGTQSTTSRWFATIDRPVWRIDRSLSPVQAWRDVIVRDVVCDGAGTCMEREQAVRAPWGAACRCYWFADALGRRWVVE